MDTDQLDLTEDIDDLGWVLTPNAEPEKLGRARKRRMRAELTKWRDWYRRHGQEAWALDAQVALDRLDAGWQPEA